MKILLSPAKKLDFKRKTSTEKKSELFFQKKAMTIQLKLKTQSAKQLSKLMGLSNSLAQFNWERNQVLTTASNEQSRQAIFAYDGDVYKGLDAYSLDAKDIDYLQKNLLIISGLYGILKPLDPIMPHRLEMSTKFGINTSKNLYQYWEEPVTSKIDKLMGNKEVLINLASNEYFKVIDKKKLKRKIIRCHFKELRDGELKAIMLWVKQARGMMARYLAKEKANTTEMIKGFSLGNYNFDENISDENNFVFIR